MSDSVLPVTPEVGDTVRVKYQSEQAELAENEDGVARRPVKSRIGTVEQVRHYRHPPTEGYETAFVRAVFVVVRTSPEQVLVAPVRWRDDGETSGGRCYSVNFDGDGRLREFLPKGTDWWSYRYQGEKTRQVELGRVMAVEFVSVGDE